MGKADFSHDFTRDAVAQITGRGYRVADVSERTGVSPHSLYAWKRPFALRPEAGWEEGSEGGSNNAEIRQLKRKLPQVREERDLLKNSRRVFRHGCQVKYAVVAEHRAPFSGRAMCRC